MEEEEEEEVEGEEEDGQDGARPHSQPQLFPGRGWGGPARLLNRGGDA